MFKVLFYKPTFNFLIILYQFFGNNLGWAIIAMAVLSRLITFPLTKKQIKLAAKGKEMQKKIDKIKKKYKKNEDKMNEELLKVQSKYLPSQLGGCLPIIILIMLLIQVRAGIVNLVDRGWNAFNEVAYSESLKKEEDYIKYSVEEDLEVGEHTFKLELESDEGNKLTKEYKFELVEDLDNRLEEIKEEEFARSDEEKQEESLNQQEQIKAERSTEISVYSEFFNESGFSIPLKKFLIFTTDTKTVYLTEEKQPEFEFFVRPPSNQEIISDATKVFLDDAEVTDSSEINQGEILNLNFFGLNLSKVAADFPITDSRFIPYFILGLLVGGSQFATSRILSGIRSVDGDKKQKSKKKSKKKKKVQDDEMPDMSEILNMTSKQMMIMLPLLTTLTSLGYWGGSKFFPSGLSIFWTVQSLFVIIQQSLMNKDKLVLWLRTKFSKKKVKTK